MACCLFSSKPLPDSMLITQRTLGNKVKWDFYQISHIFIQENAVENVSKMSAILLATNRNKILIKFQTFSSRKFSWKCQQNVSVHPFWSMRCTLLSFLPSAHQEAPGAQHACCAQDVHAHRGCPWCGHLSHQGSHNPGSCWSVDCYTASTWALFLDIVLTEIEYNIPSNL